MPPLPPIGYSTGKPVATYLAGCNLDSTVTMRLLPTRVCIRTHDTCDIRARIDSGYKAHALITMCGKEIAIYVFNRTSYKSLR